MDTYKVNPYSSVKRCPKCGGLAYPAINIPNTDKCSKCLYTYKIINDYTVQINGMPQPFLFY